MGVSSNIDLKPVPGEVRREEDLIDQASGIVEEKIRTSVDEGVGYTPKNWDGASERVVTNAILEKTRGVEGAPVIPAGYTYDADGRVIWHLSPYHYNEVMMGRVCHACLEWQEEAWTPHCSWRGKQGDGCGADRQVVNPMDLHGRVV